jgi:hypothetical protein
MLWTLLRRLNLLACGVALLSLVAACQPTAPSTDGPEAIIKRYYEAQQRGDLDAVIELFLSTQAQPREVWRARLAEYKDKLGVPQSFEIRDTMVNTVYSGQRFTVRVVATYPTGPATETLVLFQDVAGNPAQIEALSISAKALRQSQ